ncbi:MAG: YaeQ family protein [Verrucomicrobiales bacterium]|nr:YaeQ family protein [Verrucomicrobiales bacterium]
MAGRFTFQLTSANPRLGLPYKVLFAQRETETPSHVLLKLLGFLMFFRERLQIEPRLPDDNIPFEPDLVELDYTLRPVLWVECGECSVTKLDKLAVKAPEAALWVLKRCYGELENLRQLMERHGLRRGRYHLVGFEAEGFLELLAALRPRNEVFWAGHNLDPPEARFDFNGLWYELPFRLVHF